MVKNAAAKSEAYNIGLYKNDELLAVQQNVHFGTEVQFQLHNSLSFGVVQNMSAGEVIDPDKVMSPIKFDLDKFSSGLVVTLSQDPASGEYVFTGTSGE